MTALQVSDKLASEIRKEAEERGLSVENFLETVVQRERTLAHRRKIEQEQAWWLSLPLSRRAKYERSYVAVHNQELIDHDKNEDALHRRIRARYGKLPILIMPAEGPRDIHIYSPRFVHT